MPVGYYKELIRELSDLGFSYARQGKGSHEKWHNPATKTSVLVPRNLDSRHTANDILKSAGSTKKF
jgi:predicted RNA binding protein YcfA (HicA-like mRNA interferase family)